jgi:hypothetical protein
VVAEIERSDFRLMFSAKLGIGNVVFWRRQLEFRIKRRLDGNSIFKAISIVVVAVGRQAYQPSERSRLLV